MKLNYEPADKKLVEEAENKRGYRYYEFTEESTKNICAKSIEEVTGDEWRSLIQMLYPHDLICSGLFEPFIIFKIVNDKRKDPPYERFPGLDEKGSDGILLERIITALKESGISVNESWEMHLAKAKSVA